MCVCVPACVCVRHNGKKVQNDETFQQILLSHHSFQSTITSSTSKDAFVILLECAIKIVCLFTYPEKAKKPD